MVQALFALAVLALLAAKLHLVGLQNINWDEFLFLSWLHDYRRGELSMGLQTFHVHFLGWLARVSQDPVEQILAGRAQAFFLLRLGSCACLFLIGRRLVGTTGAWFALIAALTFSFVLVHGESFRADPIIAFLFLAAVALIICVPEKIWPAALAGLLMALATAVSVKTAFYLPTLAVILLLSWLYDTDHRLAWRRALAGAASMALSLVLMLSYHAAVIADEAAVQGIAGQAAGSARVMWGLSQPAVLQLTLAWDRAFWVLLGLGIVLAATTALASPTAAARRSALVVLALALPMASLTIYRNSFPYYYVCLVPPASLACGMVAAQIESRLQRYPQVAALAILLLAVPLLANAAVFLKYNGDDTLAAQRELLDGVAEVFPQSVPYIDRCSMMSTYPKVGLFMSTLVLARYREQGEPVMEKLVRARQPLFLIANSPGLMLDLPYERVRRTAYALLQPDFEFLREQFIPHWGPLWVIGKQIEVDGAGPTSFEIVVGGRYTLESEQGVELDGVLRRPGEVIALEPGTHSVRGAAAAQVLRLRYGEHLPVPARAPPSAALFTGLGFRRP